jgi:hypothetical protein
MGRLRADANGILEPRSLCLDAEAMAHDIEKRSDLLCPVPRDASADGEYAEPSRLSD